MDISNIYVLVNQVLVKQSLSHDFASGSDITPCN